MPIRRIEPSRLEVADTFVTELSAELRRSREEPLSPVPAGAPDIIEEITLVGIMHVTVVWDAWGHIPIEKRGAIIYAAYRELGGEAEIRMISVALGLTKYEANRLGIEH